MLQRRIHIHAALQRLVLMSVCYSAFVEVAFSGPICIPSDPPPIRAEYVFGKLYTAHALHSNLLVLLLRLICKRMICLEETVKIVHTMKFYVGSWGVLQLHIVSPKVLWGLNAHLIYMTGILGGLYSATPTKYWRGFSPPNTTTSPLNMLKLPPPVSVAFMYAVT